MSLSRAQIISNRIPFNLTRELYNQGLWNENYDDISTLENKSLNVFLDGLREKSISSSEVVDNIFGKNFTYSQFDNLYRIKILILRYLRDRNNGDYSLTKIKSVNKLFKLRYIESIVSLVKLSKVEGLDKISDNFIKKINSNEIQIADLSPDLRKLISSFSSVHTHEFQARTDARYHVSGAFLPRKSLFVLDFAGESFEQTIVTFVHEMIHAANPDLEIASRRFFELLPQAHEILVKWSGDQDIFKSINTNFIKSIFLESKNTDISDLFLEKDNYRLIKLHQILDVQTLPDREIAVVNKWIQSGLELTVFNEYHAYGKSLEFLSELINEFKIVKGDVTKHKALVENFKYGDDAFVAMLSNSFDPFSNLKIYSFRYRKNKKQYEAYRRLLQYLEYLYLKNIKDRVSFEKTNYSRSLNKIRIHDQEPSQNSGLIDVDSNVNPYEVIGSRVTGVAITKIENNLSYISTYLKSAINKLHTTKAGILDLSDVSSAELKLLGIQWQGSAYQINEKGLESSFYKDISDIDVEVLKYFEPVSWAKDNMVNDRGRFFVDGDVLNEKILKLRLLKLSQWLRSAFEPWTNSLLGARVFYEKLNSELYFDKNDLGIDRAIEFENIIVELLENSNEDYDSLNKLSILFDDLCELYLLTDSSELTFIRSDLENMINILKRSLERVGVSGLNSKMQNIESLMNIGEEFKGQLSFFDDYCKRSSFENLGAIGKYGSLDKFSLNEERFYLMISCYKKKAYAVRQPGDFSDYMTVSFASSGDLVAKIFKGSRKIRLTPIKETKKIKKKSSFFDLFF